MRLITYIIILIIIAIGITFAGLNSQTVHIDYYVGISQLPLSILLALALIVGAVLGMLAATWMMIRLKSKNLRLQHRVKMAEKEVENLRALPLNNT